MAEVLHITTSRPTGTDVPNKCVFSREAAETLQGGGGREEPFETDHQIRMAAIRDLAQFEKLSAVRPPATSRERVYNASIVQIRSGQYQIMSVPDVMVMSRFPTTILE